ncbi:MAG: hypothetical protein QM230_03615 [Chloroflexota bacterium]|jgi:hypothetical protein|nr:hypothetical protein [Chloroflexota bacterium]
MAVSRHTARPDGKITLTEFIHMIPDWQQRLIEADINALIEAGYGDLSFRIVDGKLTTWQVTISRKVQVKKD